MSGRVHLAHHWWVWQRGGGRVFEDMAALFPEAGVSMIVYAPETLTLGMAVRTIFTSALQRIAPRWVDHRWLLAFFPAAVRRMRAPEGTRLLLSSDAAVIKGMRKPPGCVQVCYCHSPPRYLWGMTEDYARHTSGLGGLGRKVFRRVAERVRRFDLESSGNVDHFIANSQFVAERILRCYGRKARVIYPAVDIERLRPSGEAPGDYFLVVSELVSYKRVDLAVDACSRLGLRLIVVGDGAEAKALRARAGKTVEFVGRTDDAEVVRLMAGCRALLHPQVEDFGLTPVEVQAAGRPVIALGIGGALETVIDGQTGLFFAEQSVDGLADAIGRFEALVPGGLSVEACRRNAERFSRGRFQSELKAALFEWLPDAGALFHEADCDWTRSGPETMG
jgi:glycosyltransferase involved in cell wall biosynthesis